MIVPASLTPWAMLRSSGDKFGDADQGIDDQVEHEVGADAGEAAVLGSA